MPEGAAVQFGGGCEPWSVARGGVKRWLHCRVDVESLPDVRRAELAAWFTDHEPPAVLLVTRGDDGHRLHLPSGALPVELADLPDWLQRPEPPPQRPAIQRRTTRQVTWKG